MGLSCNYSFIATSKVKKHPCILAPISKFLERFEKSLVEGLKRPRLSRIIQLPNT